MQNPELDMEQIRNVGGEDFALVCESLVKAYVGSSPNRIAKVGIKWLATLIRKNKDYGSSVWNTPILAPECSPGTAIRVRMSDKVSRLNQLLSSDDPPNIAESIDDTLGDLGSYCLLELARPGRESNGSPTPEISEAEAEQRAEAYRLEP